MCAQATLNASFALGEAIARWTSERGTSQAPMPPAMALAAAHAGLDVADFQAAHSLPTLINCVHKALAPEPMSPECIWILVGVAVRTLCEAARPTQNFGGFLHLGTPASAIKRTLSKAQLNAFFLTQVERLLGELASADYYGKQDVAAKVAAYVSEIAEVSPQLKYRGRSRKEKQMEPLSIITAIGAGLSLVDKFVDLVKKLRAKDVTPHRVTAKTEGDSLEIRRDGVVVERVTAKQLNLNAWDAPRFEALRKRVSAQWNQFNSMYGDLPTLAVDEQARIREKMEYMRQSLCQDFREMLQISESVLGVPLEDHYTLYSTCQDNQL